jgi:lysophospholipase
VFEFSPFELGSWDPTLSAFAPLPYIASNFSGGSIPSDGKCVQGFDQAGFIMGTSSSLFNYFLLSNMTGSVPAFVADSIRSVLTSLDESNNDIAQYSPNPFKGYNPGANSIAGEQELTLVDGGLDLQNIPLQPVLQPRRRVDIIFAVDSSADTTTNWPNGTALRATYDRSRDPIANGIAFPPVPSANTFINLGLNHRPTFFGCDVKNFTNAVPPLVVYVPNAPYTARSNVSTFERKYEIEERNRIIRNGYDSATQGNGTVDPMWTVCVACAMLSRSFDRTATDVPSVCGDCFKKYCWDGTVDERDVGVYDPNFIIGETKAEQTGDGATVESLNWMACVTVGVAWLLLH